MSVLTRRAGRRDLEAILTLWRLLREHEHKLDSRFETNADAEAIAREHHEMILADPRSGMFVAEEQGEVLGYLHAQIETNPLGHLPPRHGEIVNLIVREDRRREGIARRLLDYAREWLDSQGVGEYRVDVPVNSEPAHRLIGAVGARPRTITYSAEFESQRREDDSAD